MELNKFSIQAKQYGAEYGKPLPGSESEKRSAEVKLNVHAAFKMCRIC
jgi:hypothetical protein